MLLERLPLAALDEQRFEHVLDRRRPARGPARRARGRGRCARPRDRRGSRSPSPFVSRTIGTPGVKYGSPTSELAAPADLDDDAGLTASDLQEAADRQAGADRAEHEAHPEQDQRRQRERRAPARRRRPRGAAGSRGSAITLPRTRKKTASTEPASPQISPSSMNGPRTNQFVAPTSFITSISRRREKIESRIVFEISRIDAITSTTRRDREHHLDHVRDREDAVRGLLAVAAPVDAGRLVRQRRSSRRACRRSRACSASARASREAGSRSVLTSVGIALLHDRERPAPSGRT